MRQLCFIIAILGDDPEDTLARAMVKWLLGQGVNVMTMSPAKGEGNHSYPLERVEKAIAWLQAHSTHFVFPEGMMKNYSFVFQNVYLFHDTIANNIRFVQDRRQAASWKL